MRGGALCLAAVLLTGCASPSPEYFGVAPQRVTVEGTEIAVYRRGERAQAIRLGGARRASMGRSGCGWWRRRSRRRVVPSPAARATAGC